MKNSISLLASVAVVGMLTAGCSNKLITQEYSASADNVMELRKFDGVKVSVGKFGAVDPEENTIDCRSIPLTTPNGEPFQDYVQNALSDELKMAGIYDKNAPVKLTGYLKNIDYHTTFGDAHWEFDLEVVSSNGKSLVIHTLRKHPYAFPDLTACMNLTNAFKPAVRQLISDVVTNEKFPALLGK